MKKVSFETVTGNAKVRIIIDRQEKVEEYMPEGFEPLTINHTVTYDNSIVTVNGTDFKPVYKDVNESICTLKILKGIRADEVLIDTLEANDCVAALEIVKGDTQAWIPLTQNQLDEIKRAYQEEVDENAPEQVKKENQEREAKINHAKNIIDQVNNPAKLMTAKQRDKKIAEYRRVMLEGGEGYNPFEDIITKEQYQSAKETIWNNQEER
ncbi:hypothetical protein DM469_00495 [Lactobacillus helveticus]|uniref:hypothetical protein n=1 Tax=Lactobacillus helveticus TaxID=1587 RepID=UPI000D7CE62D|nr:hypothetical protein [Lactobacillus helveticus]PXZ24287.1 hypothetical protein DM468_00805 [Lactobacillus helveticus]PXZ27611.1 hypothetical protein DM472_00495 [Lactobacillus helveticus]PXZ31414.1 hypothetical protein DM467_00495 [Lactobacillus helveticus]PXZ36189.1 hypothetical protein DM469_00495 [Lactobacillus helveticus]PXZ37763.1 hypothetical protein DM466_00495 [Lactobacillus helveticus]